MYTKVVLFVLLITGCKSLENGDSNTMILDSGDQPEAYTFRCETAGTAVFVSSASPSAEARNGMALTDPEHPKNSMIRTTQLRSILEGNENCQALESFNQFFEIKPSTAEYLFICGSFSFILYFEGKYTAARNEAEKLMGNENNCRGKKLPST